MNEIFDTLPNTQATETEDPLEKAVLALTNYFTPKQNREYEIYIFRQAKQEADESITAFHTRLRQLSLTCEFENVDREIKTQVVQSCSSHKLRMKALENPQYTLTQLLDAGKAMELSKIQAASIEDKQVVHTMSSNCGNRSQRRQNKSRKAKQDGGRPGEAQRSRDRKSRNISHDKRKSSEKCRNCGREYPHQGGKTACPAYGKACRGCGKMNHFQAVCRGEGRSMHRLHADEASSGESSDDDEVYTFSLSTNQVSKDQPLFEVKVQGTPVVIMADSGASINVLDEKDFHRLPNGTELEHTAVKIFAYQSNSPLHVIGKFSAIVESDTKKVNTRFYVVKGSGGSLLSWKTSQELNLLQIVQQVTTKPSTLKNKTTLSQAYLKSMMTSSTA